MKNTQVGIPSPNPSYPSPVEVVKGDNEVVVGNKNWFDYNKITNSAYYTNNYDGSFTRNSNGSNILINVNSASVPYDTLSLKQGTYSVSFDIITTNAVTLNNFFMCTVQSGTAKNLSKSISTSIPANTTTHIKAEGYVVESNAEKVGFAGYLSASTGVVISNIQLEKGPATAFQPHQEQVYPISLGSIELAKIGTYQDKLFKAIEGDVVYDSLTSTQKEGLNSGNWYKGADIIKFILNGTENWENPTTNLYNVNNITPNHLTTANIVGIISDNYVGGQTKASNSEFMTSVSNLDFAIGLHTNGTSIRVKDTRGLSLSDFKAQLSTNNVTVYYVLATPTFTEITDTTLITQLENWRNSKSYQGQTNISQTNEDKAFVISYTTLKQSEGTDIDLTDYVKNTDYADYSKAGVIKVDGGYGTSMDTGKLRGVTRTYQQYTGDSNLMLISKVTLENVITGKELISQTELDTALADKSDKFAILIYGQSTWQDFVNAYSKNAIVYCAVPSSNSYRMAFMAYVSGGATPTQVEFQYYRSVSSHSASQQGDQVFVYTLASSGTWTTISREASSKIVAGTGLALNYASNQITLSVDAKTTTDTTAGNVYDVTYINSMLGNIETLLGGI